MNDIASQRKGRRPPRDPLLLSSLSAFPLRTGLGTVLLSCVITLGWLWLWLWLAEAQVTSADGPAGYDLRPIPAIGQVYYTEHPTR